MDHRMGVGEVSSEHHVAQKQNEPNERCWLKRPQKTVVNGDLIPSAVGEKQRDGVKEQSSKAKITPKTWGN